MLRSGPQISHMQHYRWFVLGLLQICLWLGVIALWLVNEPVARPLAAVMIAVMSGFALAYWLSEEPEPVVVARNKSELPIRRPARPSRRLVQDTTTGVLTAVMVSEVVAILWLFLSGARPPD